MPQITILYNDNYLRDRLPDLIQKERGVEVAGSLAEVLAAIGQTAKRTMSRRGRIAQKKIVCDSRPFGLFNDRAEPIEIQILFGRNHQSGTNWQDKTVELIGQDVHDIVHAMLTKRLGMKVSDTEIGVWMLPVGNDFYIYQKLSSKT